MGMQSGGGEEGGNECSTTDANAEQYPAWDASTIYTNETVSHNSFVYQAKWWTQGNEPGSDSVWVNIGPAACH